MASCREIKLTLSGKTHVYDCELVRYAGTSGILNYVIDRYYEFAGITLKPGDITRAFYWSDRPYTLYVWQLQERGSIYYFNVADRISLTPEEFIWRDLAVDILIDADLHVQILDEHELPSDLPIELSHYIESAKKDILRRYKQIIAEVQPLLPAIF